MQIEPSFEATALFSSKVLLQQITDYLEVLNQVSSSENLTKLIQTDFVELTNYYSAIGEQEHNRIASQESVDVSEIYLLHYIFPETFKDVALLHRDVLLQLQIAQHKALEGNVDDVVILSHFSASKQLLCDVIQCALEVITNSRKSIYESEKAGKKLLSSIQHQNNPWSIYKAQFETIKTQLKVIANNDRAISKTVKVFEDIKAYNSTLLSQVNEDAESLKKHLGEALKQVKDLEKTEDISTIISWIDNTLHSVSKDKNLQEEYAITIENKIKMLNEATIPVTTENGLILTKKIDFNKTVKKWFDFEILPILIDLWENKTNMNSYFKHSLLNLKSGLLVEKNNNSLEAVTSQLQTLKHVHHTLSSNASKIMEIINESETKFSSQFNATNIYSNEDFLEVSLQSSLSQFALEQGNFLAKIKNKLGSRFNRFNKTYERSTLFSNQNKVEDSIHCINYRMFKEDNAHYDTLFLNKNFIGDLFLLPRQEEELKFNKSIEQWQNGFNKAILITGDSLSGKSTFVDYISKKYFGKSIIRIEKDSNLTYGGRKFSTTKDLKDALQNLKKGTSNTRPIVIIDDLELWKDDATSLLNNVRALLDFVTSESDNVLVVVTTSKQMQEHLDKRIRFSEAFSTTLKLDKATTEEVYKAIVLRHGASHKKLVSSNLEPLSTKQIEQNILKLTKRFQYNIGEVLQAWTYGTTMIENNMIIYEDKDPGFKDFFNTEEIIILKHVLLYKQINEFELKGYVGDSYNDGYNSSIKRLTNTKVLLRDEAGQLKLNPVVNTDIKQLLIYRGILN